MNIQRDYNYYEAHSADVKLEEITSSDENKRELQRLRDGNQESIAVGGRWGFVLTESTTTSPPPKKQYNTQSTNHTLAAPEDHVLTAFLHTVFASPLGEAAISVDDGTCTNPSHTHPCQPIMDSTVASGTKIVPTIDITALSGSVFKRYKYVTD